MLFNKDTFYPNIEVKSLYYHDTRRELPGKVMEGDQACVLQGFAFKCLISSLCLYIFAISTPETGYCENAHPHNPCHHDWSTD